MTDAQNNNQSWRELLAGIADAWPAFRWRDVGVVIGCSGGADSVALVLALVRLRQVALGRLRQEPVPTPPPRGFLVAAHFNHGLRGDESDADEAFVRELAGEQEVRFVSGRSVQPHRDEATMRRERLRFLADTAHELGARYVALAHSADDNVETVLHHLIRGTGPAGLAGIGSPRSIDQDLVLIRPLLRLRRDQIRTAMAVIGQPWREDSSNENIDYRRNWIRHRLLPLIESEYPSAVDAIGRAIDGQRDWRIVIDGLAQDWLATHRESARPLQLSRDQTTAQPIIIAALQALWAELGWSRGEMTREHWVRLATTIQSDAQERYSLPGQIDVTASGDRVKMLSSAGSPA